MNKPIQKYTDLYVFECPHCNNLVTVSIGEVNCGIFRHAVYKNTGKQVPPHSSQEKCEALIKANKVYGCGKPFRINNDIVEPCDYST
jgi:hypothetical protein